MKSKSFEAYCKKETSKAMEISIKYVFWYVGIFAQLMTMREKQILPSAFEIQTEIWGKPRIFVRNN